MLERFFRPKSVAVVGASREEGKVGFSVLDNLLKYGFAGKVFPVNPKASEILGVKTYPDIASIPEQIEFAVLVVPPPACISSLAPLAQKGCDSAVVISAGFKEGGAEGAKKELELAQEAKRVGMRLIGPNCLGLIDTHSGLNASFAAGMPPQGSIAFFSQSGALCTAILDWAQGEGVGFSKFISLGNKADLSELELLDFLADDPETKVILGYLEGVEDGPAFMQKARAASKKKPLIITKAGFTAAGAKAASSHTGTLAGSDKAFQAAFLQSGVIRARSLEDLFDFALAFAYQPLPQAGRLAILTNAGGPGIIAADAAEESRVELAVFKHDTINKLKKVLPPTANLYNPVDIIGDAREDRYQAAMEALLEDEGVDGLLVLLSPQAMTEPEKPARVVGQLSETHDKTVLASFMGEATVKAGWEILKQHGVPHYPFPERAVRSFKTMVDYARWRLKPEPQITAYKVEREKVAQLLKEAKERGEVELGERYAREVIEAYGFHFPQNILAKTAREAAAAASGMNYPVVMKIASPDILHKTEVGGVRLNLRTAKEVEKAFQEITGNARRYMPQAIIWGTSVQEMVTGGKEVILGMSRDPSFGPLIMFGLGGIYVEVLKDVSFRIAPLDVREARQMVKEIHAYPLLHGVRGEKPSDIEGIVESLCRLSQLVTDFPQILELDINPLVVKERGQGVTALDARLVIKG